MKTIVLNEVGYRVKAHKEAVLNFDAKDFGVFTNDGKEVFRGKVKHFGKDDLSGEDTYIADFSEACSEGTYYVEADGVKSVGFSIKDAPFCNLMQDLLKTFYFLRCGSGLDEKFAGVYRHGKCHTALAKVWGDEETLVDVTGGWHDAGDYGRYTTAGACAAAHLLYAFKDYPILKEIKFNIPSDGNLPDILAEIKVELDFLMKMQREDGGAYHKVTTMRHADFIMPEEDRNDLFLFPVSSLATADLAAVCALAYTVYKDYDKEYAEKLLNTATKAYEWLSENPEEVLFKNPPESNTGEYGEAEDISNRFWAYASLYAATGDELYKRELLFTKKRYDLFIEAGKDAPDRQAHMELTEQRAYTSLGWEEVAGLGTLSILSIGADDDLSKELSGYFVKEADRLVEISKKNGYGVCMDDADYIWGSNFELGKYMMILAKAVVLTGNGSYTETLEKGLDYLLGCNPLNVSYITGNGENAFKNPHLRPTAVDGIDLPWPGLVSGGPNKGLQDELAQEVPKDTPPMKCYLDEVPCYSLNEITIYWNSPVVYALASIL